MSQRKISYVPFLEEYMTHYNMNTHNKHRYIEGILYRESGKYYKQYYKFLNEINYVLKFNLKEFNIIQQIKHEIEIEDNFKKNTKYNTEKLKIEYNRIYDNYEKNNNLDYKTKSFKHFKTQIKSYLIAYCNFIAGNNEIKRRQLINLFNTKICELSPAIISIFCQNEFIEKNINYFIKCMIVSTLNKTNIPEEYKDEYLKEGYITFTIPHNTDYNGKELVGYRNIKSLDKFKNKKIKKEWICETGTFIYEKCEDCCLTNRLELSKEFIDNLIIIAIYEHPILIDNIIIENIKNPNEDYMIKKMKAKKRHDKSMYKWRKGYVERLENEDIKDINKINFHRNKISEYIKNK